MPSTRTSSVTTANYGPILVKQQATAGVPETLPSLQTAANTTTAAIAASAVSEATRNVQSQRSRSLQRREVTGRLISLSHADTSLHAYLQGGDESDTIVVINFPSMPKAIELARQTNYKVSENFAVPDGIHLYQSTSPLIIPFSFELHAGDEEFCSQGCLSLLAIAARLHALALPIYKGGRVSVNAVTVSDVAVNGTRDAELSKRADNPTVNLSQTKPPAFPVACLLDLISAGSEAPGVQCVGYVKDPKVKLKGPWLQPAGSGLKNMPTSAEYSFSFVHRPGHTNNLTGDSSFSTGLSINAYADDIKSKLYNTLSLQAKEGITYIGFGQS